MKDRHVRRTGSDYTSALMALFPQGMAWPRNVSATLYKLVDGTAQVMGDIDGRAADLLTKESDPRYADEMLDDWERNFALPDICLPYPPTTQFDRRVALVAKMTMLGAQDRNFFTDIAASLGQSIDIQEYAPYMCGVSRCGDTRSALYGADSTHYRWQLGSPEMRFYWTVDLTSVLSGAECVLRRYGPAHTELVIKYNSTLERAMATYYLLGF
jgi:uncharacterized protein YmfQ (DUF2313 family)